MCLWGSWTWHGTYCRSLIKTSALSAETLGMLASCSFFFSASHSCSWTHKESRVTRVNTLDYLGYQDLGHKIKSVRRESSGCILSLSYYELGITFTKQALQISFWPGMSVSTNSEKEHLVKGMWYWDSDMALPLCSVWNRCFWRCDQILIFAPFSLVVSHH